MEHYISIKHQEDYIAFYQGTSEIYSINNHLLPEIRVDSGLKVSEWVTHLNGRLWVTPDLLYRLAKIIRDYKPDSGINWHDTFFPVEKGAYIDRLYEVRNPKVPSDVPWVSEASIQQDAIEYIEFAQQIDHEKVNLEIRKLVERKLKKYGII